jgi:hypothetical protein
MWVCPRGHRPQEFVVFLNDELDPDGIGILVYPDGIPTARWADGTAGIGKERSIMAEEEETAHCPDCMNEPAGHASETEARWVDPVRIILEVNYLPDGFDVEKRNLEAIAERLAVRLKYKDIPNAVRDPQVWSVNVEIPEQP